jgi:hypothetical protein
MADLVAVNLPPLASTKTHGGVRGQAVIGFPGLLIDQILDASIPRYKLGRPTSTLPTSTVDTGSGRIDSARDYAAGELFTFVVPSTGGPWLDAEQETVPAGEQIFSYINDRKAADRPATINEAEVALMRWHGQPAAVANAYYVNPDSGVNTNNGQTAATPWKDLSQLSSMPGQDLTVYVMASTAGLPAFTVTRKNVILNAAAGSARIGRITLVNSNLYFLGQPVIDGITTSAQCRVVVDVPLTINGSGVANYYDALRLPKGHEILINANLTLTGGHRFVINQFGSGYVRFADSATVNAPGYTCTRLITNSNAQVYLPALPFAQGATYGEAIFVANGGLIRRVPTSAKIAEEFSAATGFAYGASNGGYAEGWADHPMVWQRTIADDQIGQYKSAADPITRMVMSLEKTANGYTQYEQFKIVNQDGSTIPRSAYTLENVDSRINTVQLEAFLNGNVSVNIIPQTFGAGTSMSFDIVFNAPQLNIAQVEFKGRNNWPTSSLQITAQTATNNSQTVSSVVGSTTALGTVPIVPVEPDTNYHWGYYEDATGKGFRAVDNQQRTVFDVHSSDGIKVPTVNTDPTGTDAAAGWNTTTDYTGLDNQVFTLTTPATNANGELVTANGIVLANDSIYLLKYRADRAAADSVVAIADDAATIAEILLMDFVGVAPISTTVAVANWWIGRTAANNDTGVRTYNRLKSRGNILAFSSLTEAILPGGYDYEIHHTIPEVESQYRNAFIEIDADGNGFTAADSVADGAAGGNTHWSGSGTNMVLHTVPPGEVHPIRIRWVGSGTTTSYGELAIKVVAQDSQTVYPTGLPDSTTYGIQSINVPLTGAATNNPSTASNQPWTDTVGQFTLPNDGLTYINAQTLQQLSLNEATSSSPSGGLIEILNTTNVVVASLNLGHTQHGYATHNRNGQWVASGGNFPQVNLGSGNYTVRYTSADPTDIGGSRQITQMTGQLTIQQFVGTLAAMVTGDPVTFTVNGAGAGQGVTGKPQYLVVDIPADTIIDRSSVSVTNATVITVDVGDGSGKAVLAVEPMAAGAVTITFSTLPISTGGIYESKQRWEPPGGWAEILASGSSFTMNIDLTNVSHLVFNFRERVGLNRQFIGRIDIVDGQQVGIFRSLESPYDTWHVNTLITNIATGTFSCNEVNFNGALESVLIYSDTRLIKLTDAASQADLTQEIADRTAGDTAIIDGAPTAGDSLNKLHQRLVTAENAIATFETSAQVQQRILNLIDGAPLNADTLAELAQLTVDNAAAVTALSTSLTALIQANTDAIKEARKRSHEFVLAKDGDDLNTDIKVTFGVGKDKAGLKIADFFGLLPVAPTGSAATVQVSIEDSSNTAVYSETITFADGARLGTNPVLPTMTLAGNEQITIEVTAVGSTSPGQGGFVAITYEVP